MKQLSLNQTLEPIRQAVMCGEFDRAQLLWKECAASLAERLGKEDFSEANLNEVRLLVEWSRSVVLCERSHLLDQLNAVHVAAEYEFGAPPPERRIVATAF